MLNNDSSFGRYKVSSELLDNEVKSEEGGNNIALKPEVMEAEKIDFNQIYSKIGNNDTKSSSALTESNAAVINNVSEYTGESVETSKGHKGIGDKVLKLKSASVSDSPSRIIDFLNSNGLGKDAA